ncbi:MAG: MBL fold metallo-hydrolase [Candidatus Latescibacterota bacterium]|nr:MBL fold metallo-hydrolase [Candidatus Latescibacterota bacterium]
MNRLSESLFHLAGDSCNIYVVRPPEGKPILIDCGTDLTPQSQRAGELSPVGTILLTHYHRDSCATAPSWHACGTRIVLPFAERRLLEEGDLLRASFDVFNNYTSYAPCSGPLTDLPSPHYAHDYETVTEAGIDFRVVPLPGHTVGSVGYLFELDGRRVLACGDLLAAPSRLPEYHWLQWSYMNFQGHVNLLESLRTVAELDVDLVLPGHGAPFAWDRVAHEHLVGRLEQIWEMFEGRPFRYFSPEFRQLGPRVWEVCNTSARTYVVVDGEGHAVLIDSGYASASPITANPHRYIDHLTSSMESELGVRRVEYFLPTHYHDDHLAGYPTLRSRYGTLMACSKVTQALIEQPQNFDMPCLLPRGFIVDHVVAPGQSLRWRGVDFEIHAHPGQTLYDQQICFEIAGVRYLAIGDAISGKSFSSDAPHFIHSFIPKNRTPLSSYGRIPRNLAKHAPDILLTGHGGGLLWKESQISKWTSWMDRWQELFESVVLPEHGDRSMDPRWVEIVPYRFKVQLGEHVDLTLRITNHEPGEVECAVELRSVQGVEVSPAALQLKVPAEGACVTFRLRCTGSVASHCIPVIADVTWNGERLGEIGEAVGYWTAPISGPESDGLSTCEY